MTTARVVSILGTGPLDKPPPYYNPTIYEWEGRLSSKTPLVDRALCELLEPSGLIVLGTPEVRARWIESGLFKEIVQRSFDFREIPAGKTDSERWKLFAEFEKTLTLKALPEAGEAAPPTSLYIDITHGFRAQPLFLMSALAFTFSEWSREGVVPASVRIIYGAFEAQKDGTTPIWDLTEFLTVANWNAALDAFLQYGRADELEALCKAQSGKSMKEAREAGAKGLALAVHGHLRKMGAQAREVADDLALIRTQDLLTRSAPSLLELLEAEECNAWLSRLPVLRGGVDLLKKRLRSLVTASVIDEKGLRAQANLTDLYLHLQRFSEAAVTVRESLITHYGLQHENLAPLLTPPKTPGCDKQRGNIEHAWGVDVTLKKERLPDPEWPDAVQRNIELSRFIQQSRNDIEHGGFNDAASSSLRLREKLNKAAEMLGPLLRGEAPPANALEPSTGFLNLSNHPISTWAPHQIDEARALGLGEPFELSPPMDTVNPAASTDDITLMATNLASRVVASGAHGAFVSTEPSLTVALVAALQRRGVVCYTTTADREVTERVTSDGTIEKLSRFEFAGWRKYPLV